MVRYEWPGLGGLLHVRGDVSYSDTFFYNLRNFGADKFDCVHDGESRASAGRSNDAHWQVGLDVRNVTDEHAGIQGFDLAMLCGCNEVSYQPPRWYGIT